MSDLKTALMAQGIEITEGNFLLNEPMANHTTFRIGGPADAMFFPKSEGELLAALQAAKQADLPAMVIGNGSNLLVRDRGIRGMVIVLGEAFARITIEGTRLTAQAGASLSRTAAAAQEAGLSGLEFAAGIPGTLGGGCAMNAGAYGGQISDVLESARVLLNGEIVTLTNEEMRMGYRTTLPLREGGVILEAAFALKADDSEAILARMKDYNARRREKQPLNLPSAGSVFKRPEGSFAGTLIEQCGLKGMQIANAQVSEKHAGFIVNRGSATAAEVLDLIHFVQERVFKKTGVMLEPEIRIVGEE